MELTKSVLELIFTSKPGLQEVFYFRKNQKNLKKTHQLLKSEMESEQQIKAAFVPATSSFFSKRASEQTLIESFFTEIPSSSNFMTLTLTKSYIIARSPSTQSLFICEISFDLKFQVLYSEEKNVRSKKIGIKLLISNNDFNCFYSNDAAIIEMWTLHLSKHINQKGFHQMFKPIKKLGKGNFASVYEVERLTDSKKFAVKAFSKQNTFAAKNGKESLMNELSIMRSLSHSNILRLQSVYESQNSIYVVLQVLEGDQLFHKIQKSKGQFTKQEIKTFMKGLLEGLTHMHENRIMHRDLKPQNIMFRDNKSMDPVIVDFGLATNVDLSKYLFYRCGTPGYVAPQIVSLSENSHIEPECDIFSAGVIFHILLTKRPLFEGTKYDQVYRNNKMMKFDLSSDFYSKLESQELSLMKKMLTVNPKERITASEALKHGYFGDIRANVSEKEVSSPQLTEVTERGPKSRKLVKL